ELDSIDDRSRGEHSIANVRRIQPMMSDRGRGDVHARKAMHEGGRSERRLARQATVEKERPVAARDTVRAGQFHEEIVGVLSVDEWRAPVRGFPSLQQERITLLANGRGLDGEHGPQAEGSRTQRSLSHRHSHVVAVYLRVAAWPALVVIHPVGKSV